jgi:ribonucleotide monophosphatase NagD (HAD superfamily)
MRYIDAIRDLTDDHDVFLLDMWGVMHNGSQPYKGVLETVKKLKEAGKEMIILSNSSKRTDNSVKMLSKLGFDPIDFAQIITSGEVSTLGKGSVAFLFTFASDAPVFCVCMCA